MKRFNKKLICAVLILMLVLNAAACASGVTKEATVSVGPHNSVTEDAGYAEGEVYSEGAATYSNSIESGDIINNAPDPDTPDVVPAGNMLIRTVTMSITTENFDSVTELIRTGVSENGGYFENMSIEGTGTVGDYRTGTFVIRVPSENLDSLTASLSGSGTLIYSSETTEDVTLDYVDIESHLSALRTEQESLMALLEEADDLDTIVQLENYLADIRYEIESYESQARTMNNLVQYATLTMNLKEVVTEEPPVEIDEVRNETLKTRVSKAFSESMKQVKEGGKDLIVDIAGDLPFFTIRIIVLGILFGIGFSTFKIIKKRKAKKLAASAPAKPTSDKS